MAQKELFTYIDTRVPSYGEEMHRFLAQCESALSPQELLASFLEPLHRLGCTTQFPAQESWLLCAERSVGAAYTLLFYDRLSLREGPAQTLSDFPALLDICIRLAAIDAYQQVLGTLPINIKWLFDDGKEVSDLGNFLQRNPALVEFCRADACLAHPLSLDLDGEETPYFVLGTRGHLRVELSVRTSAKALPVEASAILPDVAWRLVWALSSIKNSREEVCIDGFYDTLTPLDDDEIAYLHALPENSTFLTRLWDLPQLLLGLQGFQLHYTRFLVPSCTIRTLHSIVPTSELALPECASALLDFCLMPGQDPQDIFARLQQHLVTYGFTDIQTRLLSASKTTCVSVHTPVVQALRRATSAAYNCEPFILPLAGQSGPGVALQASLALPVIYPGALPASSLERWTVHSSFSSAIKQVAQLFKEVVS